MNEETGSRGWPGGIAAITLLVEDLETARRFYQEVFELLVVYEDESSAVFRFGETLVNLLRVSEAPSLVEPSTVAGPDAGVRFQFTIGVRDVDAMGAGGEGARSRAPQRPSGSAVGSLHGQLSRSGRTHLGDRR